MNNRKICFITVINDGLAYNECLFYIKNLNIPKGYSIEIIGIRNSKSITEAYNSGMKKSDAKYKIYLHQDTLIINKDIIFDIIKVFEDNSIGMIGVCGAINIPENGIWWESTSNVGKVYHSITGEMKLLELGETFNDVQKVEAIDGLIMITQYDINWRDDLFDGWHCYDLSQSKEMIKNKYNVVVVKQNKPWCIHDSGLVNISNGFDKYRKIYLTEYN